MTIKSHHVTYRIYTEDTDLMGIVYHANYLRFLERARTEMLREKGFSLTTMSVYDTYFAIHEIQIRYLYPARLDDIITITSFCERKKHCSLLFQQNMSNQFNQTVCKATIQVVCVDKKLKPKRLPETFGVYANS